MPLNHYQQRTMKTVRTLRAVVVRVQALPYDSKSVFRPIVEVKMIKARTIQGRTKMKAAYQMFHLLLRWILMSVFPGASAVRVLLLDGGFDGIF